MRRFLKSVALPIALLGAAAACGDADNDVAFAVHAPRADVIGFWTGTGELAAPFDNGTGIGLGGAGPDAIRFPVALVLRPDRTFTLISADFPVVGQGPTEFRQCDGIFALRRGLLSLFPNRICRALPFVQYNIGRGGANRLVLESIGREFGPVADGIRARYFLERAEGPLGVGFFDD